MRFVVALAFAACTSQPVPTDSGDTTPPSPTGITATTGTTGTTGKTGDTGKTTPPQPVDVKLVNPWSFDLPAWPGTSSIRQVDLKGTGRPEFLVTDAYTSAVVWIGNCTADGCESEHLAYVGESPVQAEVADFDLDGVNEIVVVDIGSLLPSNKIVSQLYVLEPTKKGWEASPTLGIRRRSSCLEFADLDGDGDQDFVLCEFGHLDGAMWWFESTPKGWQPHMLAGEPGAIDAWPRDIDGDDDLDIVVNFAQTIEAVVLFRNDGKGNFTGEVIHEAGDPKWGSSGLEPTDFDQDGDLDFILLNGDSLDIDLPPGIDPDQHYGVQWLENNGSGQFTTHEIGRIWGPYAAKVTDLDHDDDLDVVVLNYQVVGLFTGAKYRALVWFENDGSNGFTLHELSTPVQESLAMDAADLDGDGDLDFLVGAMLQSGSNAFQAQTWMLRNDTELPKGR